MSDFRFSLITVELDSREHLVYAEAVEDPPWGGAACTSTWQRTVNLPTGRQLLLRFLVAKLSSAMLVSICEQAKRGSFAYGSASVTCDPLVERAAVVVPAGAVDQQTLSPDNAFTYHLVELHSAKETTFNALRATRHYQAVAAPILEEIGVDLGTFTDRVGNLLSFRRISSWRLETRVALDKRRRWVRALDGSTFGARPLQLRRRFYEHGELMDEAISTLAPSGGAFELPQDATAFELSLFDPSTGNLLATDAGGFISGVSVASQPVQEETFTIAGVAHTVRWIRATHNTLAINPKSPWASRSRLRRVRALYATEERQIRISTGSDRTAIVSMLRDVLARASAHVEIWDPYFKGSDVLEFLPWIAPYVNCRILCGTHLKGTPNVALSALVVGLTTQLAFVRGLPFSRRLELLFRVSQHPTIPTTWNAIYHDRFLVTDAGAWVLGASFNGIGHKSGAIVAMQSPELLLGMFDDEWNRSIVAPQVEVRL